MGIARDTRGDGGTAMDASVVRHYRRLRSLTWERRDLYPMPASLALYLARSTVAAQAFDWDDVCEVPGHCGWTFTASQRYDEDAPYLNDDDVRATHEDYVAMYRHAGQSRAVADTFARAAMIQADNDAPHVTCVGVTVDVAGPNGEQGHASLWGIDYCETDPTADGYVVEVAWELVEEAWHDARSRADQREAAELARQAAVFAY